MDVNDLVSVLVILLLDLVDQAILQLVTPPRIKLASGTSRVFQNAIWVSDLMVTLSIIFERGIRVRLRVLLRNILMKVPHLRNLQVMIGLSTGPTRWIIYILLVLCPVIRLIAFLISLTRIILSTLIKAPLVSGANTDKLLLLSLTECCCVCSRVV